MRAPPLLSLCHKSYYHHHHHYGHHFYCHYVTILVIIVIIFIVILSQFLLSSPSSLLSSFSHTSLWWLVLLDPQIEALLLKMKVKNAFTDYLYLYYRCIYITRGASQMYLYYRWCNCHTGLNLRERLRWRKVEHRDSQDAPENGCPEISDLG